MNGNIMKGLQFLSRLRVPKKRLLPFLLIIPAAAALVDFLASGLARRTFVFYDIDSGVISVEDRMLKRSPSRELNLVRYVEEALLGPASPNSLPLFPRGTKLRSLLYRDGTVYADLSGEAVLPPAEGGEVLKNLKTLRLGMRRNFPFIGEVRFFIAGKAAYSDELGGDETPGIMEEGWSWQTIQKKAVKNKI